jgi:hypothetical protein
MVPPMDPQPPEHVPPPPAPERFLLPAGTAQAAAATAVTCPKCGGPYVYESRPRTCIEKALAKFGMPVCRCHRCFHRYVVVLGSVIEKDAPLQ